MADFSLHVLLNTVAVDAGLDNLARTRDPFLQRKLTNHLKQVLQQQTPKEFSFVMTSDELNRLSKNYGEQYAADATGDLNQYFDIVNGRLFSRSVPTQLAVLYLFGNGKQYRPNVGALSAAGEGIAGYCVEKFGFKLLVRPLGIMPDAVLWTNRGGRNIIALAEAKASVSSSPQRLVEKCGFDFFLDIKTRAAGFRHAYEAFLICSQFLDGQKIECRCLQLDLRYYVSTPAPSRANITTTVPNAESPADRLRAIIRLQAELIDSGDKYLAGILSEEATRTATLELLRNGRVPDGPADVEHHIWGAATALGLAEEWRRGQELTKETKEREQEEVSQAIQIYRKPSVDLQE